MTQKHVLAAIPKTEPVITSLSESDALMELPEAPAVLEPGDLVPCISLDLLYG